MTQPNYTNEWEIKSNDFGVAGLDIATSVRQTAKEQTPEYLEFYPFHPSFKSDSYVDENLVIIRLENSVGQMPLVGKITDEELIKLAKSIFLADNYPKFENYLASLQEKDCSQDTFTYIGKCDGNKLCWPHIYHNLISWLNKFVLPNISRLNEKRVKDAIPIPPKFDTTTLFQNIYVIESESAALQGTAFHLMGVGIVTCDHCVRDIETGKVIDDLVIFRGHDITKKVKATVNISNPDIDLAILTVEENFLAIGLNKGSTDNLKQLDHVAVGGFPNYNFGDNGYFSPGLIVGFRTISALRHILVNVALVSGNSGGPAFDKDSNVIGVVVTGSDKFSKAAETEKHGLIPIEALNFLTNNSR